MRSNALGTTSFTLHLRGVTIIICSTQHPRLSHNALQKATWILPVEVLAIIDDFEPFASSPVPFHSTSPDQCLETTPSCLLRLICLLRPFSSGSGGDSRGIPILILPVLVERSYGPSNTGCGPTRRRARGVSQFVHEERERRGSSRWTEPVLEDTSSCNVRALSSQSLYRNWMLPVSVCRLTLYGSVLPSAFERVASILIDPLGKSVST